MIFEQLAEYDAQVRREKARNLRQIMGIVTRTLFRGSRGEFASLRGIPGGSSQSGAPSLIRVCPTLV